VEFTDDAFVGTTLDGIIMSWNAGAERLYGWSASWRF
jgi:PAS domain-containing protein